MNKVSKTEDRLYEAMLDIGLRPERQYQISRMKVDFAFPKERVVIEVDGHYKRNSIGMKTLFERKRVCEKEGWRVENFTAEEVFENTDKVARRIYHMIKDEERKNKKLNDWGEREELKEKKNKPIKIISKKREKELKRLFEEFESKRIEHLPKKKKNWKKIFFIGTIILGIILIGFFILNNQSKDSPILEQNEINQNPFQEDILTSSPEPPKIEPLIVEGSKTDVIITNNQEKDISLNVTYNIYSKWFGKDSTESQIFEVEAKDKRSFQVYFNDGCSHAPCLVSIINFEEI